VIYKVDQVYHKESERGIRYDDPTLAIDWRLDANEIIVSEKDLILPIDEIAWDFKKSLNFKKNIDS
jgi:dTDP-4-dehydrorhamnose 3,5-epimerase